MSKTQLYVADRRIPGVGQLPEFDGLQDRIASTAGRWIVVALWPGAPIIGGYDDEATVVAVVLNFLEHTAGLYVDAEWRLEPAMSKLMLDLVKSHDVVRQALVRAAAATGPAVPPRLQ